MSWQDQKDHGSTHPSESIYFFSCCLYSFESSLGCNHFKQITLKDECGWEVGRKNPVVLKCKPSSTWAGEEGELLNKQLLKRFCRSPAVKLGCFRNLDLSNTTIFVTWPYWYMVHCQSFYILLNISSVVAFFFQGECCLLSNLRSLRFMNLALNISNRLIRGGTPGL